jgi:AraC-like DNA-binding protein
MNLHAAFFAIDCIAVFTAMLLAVGLLTALPRNVAARWAAYIATVSAGFVVFSRALFAGWVPEPFQVALSQPVQLTLQVLMNTTPGAFMVLCFSLFDESGRRFPRALMGLLALQVGLEDMIPYVFGVTTHPSTGPTMTDSNPALYLIFETLPAALEALFVGIALFWTVRDWRSDLVETRRLQRAVLMVVIGVNIVSYMLLTRLVLSTSAISTLYVHEAYMAFNVVTNVVVLAVMLRPNVATTAAIEPTMVSADPNDPPADLDYAAFDAAMKARVYHEAGLTIASLAARLKIPEYRLRRLINTKLGYRNFNHMLHAYRVNEASEALADPQQRRVPILSIALSVGYQSINPFNRAFRDLKGTTPSAFRQDALAQSHAES